MGQSKSPHGDIAIAGRVRPWPRGSTRGDDDGAIGVGSRRRRMLNRIEFGRRPSYLANLEIGNNPVSRPTTAAIARLLGNSPQPVYLVDDNRRIRWSNAALHDWLGLESGDLSDVVCNFHSRSDAAGKEKIGSILCPPPECFSGEAASMLISPARLSSTPSAPTKPPSPSDQAGGAVHPRANRRVYFCPIVDRAQGGHWVLALMELKPAEQNALAADSEDARAWHQQLQRVRKQFAQIYRVDRIVGNSSAMRAARRAAAAAIASAADTVVIGPEGSPVEAIARTVHYSQFPPGKAPLLLPLDCTVADAEALHHALHQLQANRLEAEAGRLLLLHADRMTAPLMTELSEFISVPVFELGLISTSAHSLLAMSEDQRMDPLVARHLSTIEIRIPALCERIADLPLLAQSIVEDFNAEGNRQLAGLDAETVERLCEYQWPGDVEQLFRTVYQACQKSRGSRVSVADLPTIFQQELAAQRMAPQEVPPIQLTEFMRDVENEIMHRALAVCQGNKTQAAKLLGISRQRMIRWSTQPPNS